MKNFKFRIQRLDNGFVVNENGKTSAVTTKDDLIDVVTNCICQELEFTQKNKTTTIEIQVEHTNVIK